MEWIVPGYRHTRELGSGGSGRVVLALHEETGTPVAIKYLADEVRADPGFLTEFREEARLLGDLDTPYVVRLYEYVEGPAGAAIVMELVDGIALRALLKQAGATGPEAALVVLKGSLLGLAAAHALGVVHRDYKPENVLVAADGSSKLVDFGIAVKSGESGDIAGTPPYMAPEQWAGDPASPAADVYAATATFYECLTGSRPYPRTTFAELVVQHTTAPIPDESAPEAVRPLIRRGLAKDADERPESAAAFVTELEAVAGAAYGPQWEERGRKRLAAIAALLPLLFPSAGGSPTSGTTALASTTLGPARPPRRAPRLPRKVLAGAGGGIVLVGVLGGVALAGANNNAPHVTAGPTPVAITSISPTGPVSVSASPSGSPSASASASPSASASSSPHASASPGTSPSASPTTASPTSAPTTASPTKASPTPSPKPTPLQVSKLSDVFGYNAATLSQVIYGYASTNTTGPFTMTATWFYYQGSNPVVFNQSSLSLSGQTSYARERFVSGTPPQGNCLEYGVTLTTNPAAANGSVTETWRGTCIG